MIIRYVILNAYGGGGTVRTTLTMASALAAEGHEVHVLSIFKRKKKTIFPVDPRVQMHALINDADVPKRIRVPAKAGQSRKSRVRREARNAVRMFKHYWRAVSPETRRDEALAGQPSREFHPDEYAYGGMNRLIDRRLVAYLRDLEGGVVIGTRPGLNVAIARHVNSSVLRIGQEHLNLKHLRPGQREQNIDTYSALDALVTLTERDAENYREVMPADLFIAAVPNAVPDTGDNQADVSIPRIIAAGRFTKQKAFWRLIEAFALVADDFPEWTVDIYGSGDRQKIWQKRIDNHGLQERITFKGFTRDLHGEMSRSSIYALTSLFEGFGMVIIEAMSVGLPVISYDCPYGPRELIQDGVSGLLITPDRDVAAFATGLRRMMSDEDLRRSFVGPALAVAERHRPPIIAARWVQLFEQLQEAKAVSSVATP